MSQSNKNPSKTTVFYILIQMEHLSFINLTKQKYPIKLTTSLQQFIHILIFFGDTVFQLQSSLDIADSARFLFPLYYVTQILFFKLEDKLRPGEKLAPFSHFRRAGCHEWNLIAPGRNKSSMGRPAEGKEIAPCVNLFPVYGFTLQSSGQPHCFNIFTYN